VPDALDQLIRDVSRLSASAVVGAVDDEENASKLAYQEFGTRNAPPRPTLSAATDRLARPINDAIKRRLVAVMSAQRTMTGETILGEVGAMLAEEVRDAIDGNTPPALAPSTLAARRRRGNFSARTLVDTGKMRLSIKVDTKPGARAEWPDDGDMLD
jgi:hypothetical protein